MTEGGVGVFLGTVAFGSQGQSANKDSFITPSQLEDALAIWEPILSRRQAELLRKSICNPEGFD